ncbi:MAG: hypothetical protein ACR2NU_02680 [Aeoliella sp.]
MPKKPLDDEFDREVFYRGEDPEADAEEDYELLPPDAAVIEGEQRRAQEAVEHAKKSVDLNELYDDPTTIGANDLDEYLKDLRFRFTTRHLLIAMTVLAVLFTIGRILTGGWAPVLLVFVFMVLASTYGFFSWQEHKRQKEWEHKREELYRRHQDRRDKSTG